jgi:hypothetical protein
VGLLLLVLLPPCFTPADCGPAKHFELVFLAGFLWGIWRFAYFDIVTQNDIPGIGYLIVPFFLVAVSLGVLFIRVWLGGRVSRKAS